MLKKAVNCVLIISFMMMTLASCSQDMSVTVENKEDEQSTTDLSSGELHNEFLKAFLEVKPERRTTRLDDDHNYLNSFIKSSATVCEANGIEIKLDNDLLNQFLDFNKSLRESNIYDVFNPTSYSPPEVIDHFRDVGIISVKDAYHIQLMLKRVKDISKYDIKKDEPNGGLLFLTTAELEEASPLVLEVEDVLENSILLWEEVFADAGVEFVEFDPNDPEIVAAWWKTLIKLVATAAADTIVFAVTTYLTWNPYTIVFFSSIASLAGYECFAERGW